MKKILLIFIFIFLTAETLSACSVKSKEAYDAGAEKVIKDFVTAYYNIDNEDLNNYKTITGDFIEGDNEDGYWQFTAAVTSENKKFEALMTEDAYEELAGLKMAYQRIMEAYENQYCCQVNNISLEKYDEDIKNNMFIFYYDVEIKQISLKDGRENIVRDRRQIGVKKVNSDWKVCKVNYY